MGASAEPQFPLVSVIVVNWNGRHLLDDCFRSLQNQTWPNKEFIFVDNGSTDGSLDLMSSWAQRLPRVLLIPLPTNTGCCIANNIAFKQARGEWIALLNTDAVAEPDWLEQLVSYGDATQNVGMIASKILFQSPPDVIDK